MFISITIVVFLFWMRLRTVCFGDALFQSTCCGSDRQGTRSEAVAFRAVVGVAAAAAAALVLASTPQRAGAATPDTAPPSLEVDPGLRGLPAPASPPATDVQAPPSAPASAPTSPAGVATGGDTAANGAVSPAIPPAGGGLQPANAVDTAAADEAPATGIDARESAGAAADPWAAPTAAAAGATAAAAAPTAVPSTTSRPEVKTREATPRYHPHAAQYRLDQAARDSASGNSNSFAARPVPSRAKNPPRTAAPICGKNVCVPRVDATPKTRDRAPGTAPLDPGETAIPPVTMPPIAGCGNTNVSVRISSPGDDAPVSQVAPSGCANANISIRINSPGDNGSVSQATGRSPLGDLVASLGERNRPLLDPASTGPQLPGFAPDPAQLPAQLSRGARRLAVSLVNRTQRRVGLRPVPRDAAKRDARPSQHTSTAAAPAVRPVAPVASPAPVATVHVTASARAPVHIGRQVRRARARQARSRRAAAAAVRLLDRSAPLTQLARRASAPLVAAGSSARDGGIGATAMLVAFLAALVGSYLVVPPARLNRAQRRRRG